MSGGTLIALAADEINVDPHAALGPVDPQLGEYPAASIVAAAEQAKDPDDRTLILADVSRKALWQVERFVGRLLEQSMKPARSAEVAKSPWSTCLRHTALQSADRADLATSATE